ncbi:MAG TPA: sulfotransferase domain-containing protein [Solirubrobacterales bacterium]|nr:sulfotransferase domain-containing protein [Solirubrobacterales bacterium]
MAEVEITRLHTVADAGGELLGSAVQPPVSSSPFSLKLAGWALGPQGPPRGIRIVAAEPLGEGRTLRRVITTTAPNAPRPDVAERFPDLKGARACGFVTSCSLVGLPREFNLRVEARFEGAPRVAIARIEGRRPPLRSGYQPRFQPILLKTLGRAGSTWMTQVVGAHPQAVAYRPFDFEPRLLDYWLEIVRVLSQPHAYAQTIDPDVRERAWWEGRARWHGPLSLASEPAVERWVETESIEELAAFAQMRVDAFYGKVAESQEKPAATRFIERVHEWHEEILAHELYERARTIFLVRDMRDLLASRLAFNRKTGEPMFGYDRADSPEHYVHGWMRGEVDEWMESWRQAKDPFLVRYEDLMLRPEDTLREVFAHAELDSSADAVAATLDLARARRPERQARHMTSAGDAGSIGRWRDDLSPELQEACREAFGEALAALGYEAG